MSIYQTMSEFLNGARILETRKELMRLGWSAERANGWLLKNMVFAVSAKSEKPTVVNGARDASHTSGAMAQKGRHQSARMYRALSAKKDLRLPPRGDAGDVTYIAVEPARKGQRA